MPVFRVPAGDRRRAVDLVRRGATFKAAGAAVGVSDYAVRQWCRVAGVVSARAISPRAHGADRVDVAAASKAASEPVEAVAEPVEAVAEPVEAASEPVEAASEPVEAASEPVEAALVPVEAVAGRDAAEKPRRPGAAVAPDPAPVGDAAKADAGAGGIVLDDAAPPAAADAPIPDAPRDPADGCPRPDEAAGRDAGSDADDAPLGPNADDAPPGPDAPLAFRLRFAEGMAKAAMGRLAERKAERDAAQAEAARLRVELGAVTARMLAAEGRVEAAANRRAEGAERRALLAEQRLQAMQAAHPR